MYSNLGTIIIITKKSGTDGKIITACLKIKVSK